MKTADAWLRCLLVGFCACGSAFPPETSERPVGSQPGSRSKSAVRARTGQLPEPGRKLEFKLNSNEAVEYEFDLPANHSIGLSVEQLGLDVVMEIRRLPDGELLRVDSPTEGHGIEHVCLAADGDVRYRLTIRSFGGAADTGRFLLSTSGVNPAKERDRRCHQARLQLIELESLARRDNPPPTVVQRYHRLADEFRAIGEPFQAAVTLKSLASLLARQERLAEEAETYHEVLEFVRQAGHAIQEITTLNQLGTVEIDLARPADASRHLNQALELANSIDWDPGIAWSLNNLAILKRRTGHWHSALAYYERIQDHFAASLRPLDRVTLQHNIAICLAELQRYPEALQELQEALEIVDRPDVQGLQGSGERRSTVVAGMGRIQYFLGDYERAAISFQQALELTASHRLQAIRLDQLANAYREGGRLTQAREAYTEALALKLGIGALYETVDTRVGLAALYQDWGRPNRAVRLLEKGLTYLDEPEKIAFALTVWARAERDLGNLESARDKAERSFRTIRFLRTVARNEGEQLPPFRVWQDALEFYVELLLEIHRRSPEEGHAQQAFEIADSGRGRLFFESLLESRYNLRAKVDAGLLAREREVQDALNTLSVRRRNLLTSGNVESLSVVESELLALKSDYMKIRSQIRKESPDFARLREPEAIQLAKIQAELEPGTLLARYFLGADSSVLFLIGPRLFEAHRLPARSRIESLARSVHEGWSNQERLHSAAGATRQGATALSTILLRPLVPHLPLNRLIVVADGALHYLPFAALPVAEVFPDTVPAVSEGGGKTIPSTLIDHVELAQLPLAGALPPLRERRRHRDTPPRLLAIVAAPKFSQAETQPSKPSRETHKPWASTVALAHTQPLPEAEREADEIARLAPSEEVLVVKGHDARRSLLLSSPGLSDYRIVHIATHAVIEGGHPELYRILFSDVTEEGRILPRNAVYLHEIYSLHLPADLVVLSGCQTALGEELRGEGLVGWARGFFYAGASRLIVSLWDVQDKPTADLMIEFYRGLLQERRPPADALRQAQKKIREQAGWAHPYFWSGFVLQGDWRPIAR